MSIVDIIVLVVYFLLNIAAIITFNLTTGKSEDCSTKEKVFVSCVFVFAGLLYWVVLIFNIIRYKINNKKKSK